MEVLYRRDQRLTMKQKNASEKQWYKDKIDSLEVNHLSIYNNADENISEYKRMQTAYNICNNILDMAELSYVCKPFGEGMGELPAKMVNRDIISGKIKAFLGIEMKRNFNYTTVATNPEATTRKERKEFELIKQFAVNETMKEIDAQIAAEMEQQIKGRQLTKEENEAIQAHVAEKRKTMTPPEIERYLQREHQDPAEVQATQILEYLTQKEDIEAKFDTILEHAAKSARGIGYIGIKAGEPVLRVVNPMRFNFIKSPEARFIEESEGCSYEMRLTPSEIVNMFPNLTTKEIDSILEQYDEFYTNETLYNFSSLNDGSDRFIRVIHAQWKALREVCFLSYMDKETGEVKEMIVSEDYKLNPAMGDIVIDKEWIPEVYEGYKIGKDIYHAMQPVEGQFQDIDEIRNCKLSYHGAVYDSLNTKEVSIVDRLVPYQMLYNIVWWKLELLMGADKGKKIFMNINAVPSSEGMTTKTWQYFMESSSVVWYDPTEEGVQGDGSASTIAKEVDLSLTQDITKYLEIAEFIRRQAGVAVGITDAVEGQIAASEAVTNSQQNLVQSSHILEPYYNLHSLVKRNMLQSLIDIAKVCYAKKDSKKLSYVLDDLSRKMLTVDTNLLKNSTVGIFIANSASAEETKQTIKQLAHAAMQNQKAELSDVITVLRQKDIIQAEETLKLAEQKRRAAENKMEQAKMAQEKEMFEKSQQALKDAFEREKELIVLKETERRKTVVTQAAITGASFNPEADANGNGVNDFIELAKQGTDLQLKRQKADLDARAFEHQKVMDEKNLELQKQKLQKTGK